MQQQQQQQTQPSAVLVEAIGMSQRVNIYVYIYLLHSKIATGIFTRCPNSNRRTQKHSQIQHLHNKQNMCVSGVYERDIEQML